MNLSGNALIASMVISTIGTGFFIYGKKQTRMPQLFAGIALMVGPYFVDSVPWMVSGSCVLLAGLWFAVRAGL